MVSFFLRVLYYVLATECPQRERIAYLAMSA